MLNESKRINAQLSVSIVCNVSQTFYFWSSDVVKTDRMIDKLTNLISGASWIKNPRYIPMIKKIR
jgi:hypothetical protein